MTYEDIKYHIDQRIATATLHRPGKARAALHDAPEHGHAAVLPRWPERPFR